MATYGPRDSSTLAMPVGWDGAALEKFELEDGTTFAQVAAMLNASVGSATAEITGNPLWSSLLSYTDQPEVSEYAQSASNGFTEFSEYSRPDAKRADTTGHMLPLKPFNRALSWTWYYLRHARLPQIEADIADAVKDMGDLWRVRLLTRLLKRTDDSGAALGLGTGGYSPGFATASGSTNVDFAPPAYGGATFTIAHEHYVGIGGGLWTKEAFADIKAELLEHGHQPPYNVIVSGSDEATIRGLTGFVPVAQMSTNYSTTVSLATFGPDYRPDGYNIGVINDCLVRVVVGMPQYYGFAWKTYGANSQRNPLRVRLPKGRTMPQFEVMQDPNAGASAASPLQYIMIFTEFGVGVGQDRTNGTPRYVNNAAWSDGTPT
jgi:hypothetical protein